MSSEEIRFRDGFNFFGADFSAKSLISPLEKDNPIQFRIVNQVEYLSEIFSKVTETIEIYQFYVNEPYYENSDYKHIKIPFEAMNNITMMV